MNTRLIWTLVPTLLLSVEVAASETLRINLPQALELAARLNPSLAASARQVAAAAATERGSRGDLLPRVDVGLNVSRSDSALDAFGSKLLQHSITAADFDPVRLNNPGYITNYQPLARLSWQVYDGGANWARASQASAELEAGRLSHDTNSQQLMFDVISAYTGVRRAQAWLEASARARIAAEEHLAISRALQAKDVAIQSDVLTANVHLLNARLAETAAANGLANTLDTLRVLLDQPVHVEIELTGEPSVPESSMALGELQELAVRKRPDLLAIENRHHAAQAGVDIGRAGFLPKLELVAQQEWNNDHLGLANGNTSVAGMVTMNLFSGGSDKARLDGARAEVERWRLRLHDQEQRIRAQVARAWRDLAESRERLQAESEALQQAAEALRILKLRHEAGLERTADVLQAQAQLDRTRAEYIRAKYDVVMAQAQLRLSTGTLDEEVAH